MHSDNNMCRHCGVALKVGDARYTRDEPDFFAHYTCHKQSGVPTPTAEEVLREVNAKAVAKLDTAFNKLRDAVEAHAHKK